MSSDNVVKDLVKEHFAILSRDAEVKNELAHILVEKRMTDFFSINWRKLHTVFMKEDS